MESSIEKNEVQKEQRSINAASVGSDARSHTKKGSRHRNTEKRRLQNREAQRTYRKNPFSRMFLKRVLMARITYLESISVCNCLISR